MLVTHVILAGQTLHLHQVVALENQFLALKQNLVGYAYVNGGTRLGELLPVTFGHLTEHIGNIVDIGGAIRLRLEAFLLQEIFGHVWRRDGMTVKRSLFLAISLEFDLKRENALA